MGVWAVATFLFLAALWNAFSTFLGIAAFFDLAINFKINPVQFLFAMVVTALVFVFVIASHIIWNLKSDDIPTVFLKSSWGICVLADLCASWQGTKHFVFYETDVDLLRGVGLLIVSALIVTATMLLSKLLLGKDIRGKPFLF